MLTTIDVLREKLLRMKNPKTSWGQIASLLYPQYENKSYLRVVLYRIAKDKYDPKDNRMREALGLPQRFEVYACVECGKPHTTGCPKAAPPPPLPRCNGHPKRKPRRRIVVDLPPGTDPADLAKIRSLSPSERLEKLLK